MEEGNKNLSLFYCSKLRNKGKYFNSTLFVMIVNNQQQSSHLHFCSSVDGWKGTMISLTFLLVIASINQT